MLIFDTTGESHDNGCFPTINLFKKDGKWVSSVINVFKFLEEQKNLIANRGYPTFRTDNLDSSSSSKNLKNSLDGSDGA